MKPLDSRRSVAAALLLCLPLACAPSLAATASVMSYVDMQRDLSQLGVGISCAGNSAGFECDQAFDAPLLASDIDGVNTRVDFARALYRPGSTSVVPDGVLTGNARAYATAGSLHASVSVRLGGLGYSPGGGIRAFGYAQVEDRIKVTSSTLAPGTAVTFTTHLDISGMGQGDLYLRVRGSRDALSGLDQVFLDSTRSTSDTASLEDIHGQFTAYVGETLWLDYTLTAKARAHNLSWQQIDTSNGRAAGSDYGNSAYLYFASADPTVQWVAESGASYMTTAVPEPGTYALMLLGLPVLAGMARRRTQRMATEAP